MSGNPNQKIKLLYLKDILSEKTDDQHPMNAQELCEELKSYGVNAERKSIYSDLNALNSYGIKVCKTHIPKSGFYAASRMFEPAELRMLIDAVQASSFISAKKTKQLITKLCQTISQHQADDIRQSVYVDSGAKSENEEIYFSIEKIHRAIKEKRKIRFYYYKKQIVNGLAVNDSGKEFIFSPYALLWNSDKYYLIGNYDKYDNLIHLRLDRIKKVLIMEDASRPFNEVCKYQERFDVADYASKIFNMYSGTEEELVELICKNELLDVIIDRYGINLPFKAINDTSFSVKIKVQISDGFLSWLMEFGSQISVKSPQALADAARKKAESIAKAYKI